MLTGVISPASSTKHLDALGKCQDWSLFQPNKRLAGEVLADSIDLLSVSLVNTCENVFDEAVDLSNNQWQAYESPPATFTMSITS